MRTWLKNHYVGLTAGVIAVIALGCGMKCCSDSKDNGARVDRIETNVDSLTSNQNKIIDVVNNHESRINANRKNIDALKERMNAVEDSIDVHRVEIDSLKGRVDTVEMRVDTLAKRQAKCPCINPKPAKKPVRPARPNNLPVRHDTVYVVIRPENMPQQGQNANGCGNDQNANVVIRGDNNTVTISNNGNAAASDTNRVVKRCVTASCEATLVVNTVVTRNSYCK